MAVVEFDHQGLKDNVGNVECGHCCSKYHLTIPEGLSSQDLNDLEKIESLLTVYDSHGEEVQRKEISSEWELPTEINRSQREIGKKRTRTGRRWLIYVGFFLLFSFAAVSTLLLVDPDLLSIKEYGYIFNLGPPPQSHQGTRLSSAHPSHEKDNDGKIRNETEPLPETNSEIQEGESEEGSSQNDHTNDDHEDAEEKDTNARKKKRISGRKTSDNHANSSSGSSRADEYADQSVSEIIEAADDHLRKGKKRLAEELYVLAYSKDRYNIPANLGLAKIYQESHRMSLARERYLNVVRLGGGPDGIAYIYAARCEIELGHDKNAEELYTKYVQRYPNGTYIEEASQYVK